MEGGKKLGPGGGGEPHGKIFTYRLQYARHGAPRIPGRRAVRPRMQDTPKLAIEGTD